MKEMLCNLLLAVVTAAVPVLTTYAVKLIRRVAENAAANTESTRAQAYLKEITDAITDAVEATSQTYVDALKNAGKFTEEAQAEAARKALDTCMASISPAAQAFAEEAYGDLKEYLATKIEAEVRKQKREAPATIVQPAIESTTDTAAIAASTAAATAASVAQTALSQLGAEAPQA